MPVPQDEFLRLIMVMEPAFRRLCRSYVRSRQFGSAAAEDLAQDVLEQVVRQYSRGEIPPEHRNRRSLQWRLKKLALSRRKGLVRDRDRLVCVEGGEVRSPRDPGHEINVRAALRSALTARETLPPFDRLLLLVTEEPFEVGFADVESARERLCATPEATYNYLDEERRMDVDQYWQERVAAILYCGCPLGESDEATEKKSHARFRKALERARTKLDQAAGAGAES